MFIELPRFPDNISQDAQSTVMYSTTVVQAFSGRSQRNINWQYPLHKYDAAFGVRTMDDLEAVIAFFHVAQGRANSFRFKDWADYKSCSVLQTPSATDQVIGTGGNAATDFQLVKTYTVGAVTKQRLIQKPVTGTVLVSVNGAATTSFTLLDNGIIRFNTAPATSAVIRAGYEFDVPCCFDSDELSTQLENYNNGNISLGLTEVRL